MLRLRCCFNASISSTAAKRGEGGESDREVGGDAISWPLFGVVASGAEGRGITLSVPIRSDSSRDTSGGRSIGIIALSVGAGGGIAIERGKRA